MKHTLRTALLTIVAFATLATGVAFAANSTDNAIYVDARDGSIDGHYTLAQLRHADANIRADQREYLLWDEEYAEAVNRLTNPAAPKPKIVKPMDTNGNGTIDPNEQAAAAEKTRALNKKIAKKFANKTHAAATSTTESTSTTDTNSGAAAANSDDDGGDTNWPLIVLIAAVIVIAGVGGWRVLANRTKPGDDDEGAGPKR